MVFRVQGVGFKVQGLDRSDMRGFPSSVLEPPLLRLLPPLPPQADRSDLNIYIHTNICLYISISIYLYIYVSININIYKYMCASCRPCHTTHVKTIS